MNTLLNLDSILENWAKKTIVDIRLSMDAQMINASGRTRESLDYELTDTGIRIIGDYPFQSRTEIGRPPGKTPYSFTEIIKRWIDDKGIRGSLGITDDRSLNSVSYAIAKKIRESGSLKHRDPSKRTDVYSTVCDEAAQDLSKIIRNVYYEKLQGILQ